MNKLLAWAKEKWLPSGNVNLPIATVKRLALTIHLLAYAMIPLYQLDRKLRLKYKRISITRSSARYELELKAAKYLNFVKPLQDEHGFIHSDEGDSLLFTGLAGAAGMVCDITAARQRGRWYRRPIDNPLGGSAASTISRDMLIGLLWYCWRKKRLDLLENLWKFGKLNNWVMGTGDASRICLMPPLQGTLALMIAKLGGSRHFQRFNPQIWNAGLTGYEAHLQVLHICLMGEIEGQIDGSMWSRLREHVQRQPDNPLFQAAWARWETGDMNAAEEILERPFWPDDRLPTSADRSEAWLPQRDYGPDWRPSAQQPAKVYTGMDLVFCLSI